MRHQNFSWVAWCFAATMIAGGPALAHDRPGVRVAERILPGEFQVAQAFNEVMQDPEAGSESSGDPFSAEQKAIIQPYWDLRNEALLDLTGMITPEEAYDAVEDEWDVVCQGVFDAFAEMRAALKAAVPEGQELNPVITNAISAEQEGWITLCFEGGEIAFAHNQLIRYAEWLEYERDVAEEVLARLAEEADYIVGTMVDLEDVFEEASFAAERLRNGEELGYADERDLASFEDFYSELLHLRSAVYRVHLIVISRELAYGAFHEQALGARQDADDDLAALPDEIARPSDVGELYEEWRDIYYESTRPLYKAATADYETATWPMLTGTFYESLDTAEGLPRSLKDDTLAGFYEALMKKSEPIMATLREFEEK